MKNDLPTTTQEAIALARHRLKGATETVVTGALALIENEGPGALRKLFPKDFPAGQGGGNRPVRRDRDFSSALDRFTPYKGDEALTAGIVAEALEAEHESLDPGTDIGFMMRALALSAMPHVDPKSNEFKRRSGSFSFSMVVDSDIGLPYGVHPRLICLWLSTQIKRTGEPFVHFGRSLSAFMRDVGVEPRTGKNGNMVFFRDQLIRLAATNFSAFFEAGSQGERSLRIRHIRLLEEAEFWWDDAADDRLRAWGQVSHKFYEDIMQAAVPVSMGAIQQLKSSPMALDLYIWLTYRLYGLKRPVGIPWEFLRTQFGSQVSNGYEFKRHFKNALKKVLAVYPHARATPTGSSLFLQPSPPHVAPLKKLS